MVDAGGNHVVRANLITQALGAAVGTQSLLDPVLLREGLRALQVCSNHVSVAFRCLL
jgi:hypothetical protein